jgi:hypothetical protein
MRVPLRRLNLRMPEQLADHREPLTLRIDLFLHQQGLDTTTPAGKAMFQMLGVFAEFERAIIQERVRAGLARAKRPVRPGNAGGGSFFARCRTQCLRGSTRRGGALDA